MAIAVGIPIVYVSAMEGSRYTPEERLLDDCPVLTPEQLCALSDYQRRVYEDNRRHHAEVRRARDKRKSEIAQANENLAAIDAMFAQGILSGNREDDEPGSHSRVGPIRSDAFEEELRDLHKAKAKAKADLLDHERANVAS